MSKKHGDFILPKEDFTKEFIEETRALFKSSPQEDLTDAECVALAKNMISLELYLRELSEKYEKTPISSNRKA